MKTVTVFNILLNLYETSKKIIFLFPSAKIINEIYRFPIF
nr:MAG TPA: hypothetical protein [Caudoviricetes sp.]